LLPKDVIRLTCRAESLEALRKTIGRQFRGRLILGDHPLSVKAALFARLPPDGPVLGSVFRMLNGALNLRPPK
jgi:hypothetical protein